MTEDTKSTLDDVIQNHFAEKGIVGAWIVLADIASFEDLDREDPGDLLVESTAEYATASSSNLFTIAGIVQAWLAKTFAPASC